MKRLDSFIHSQEQREVHVSAHLACLLVISLISPLIPLRTLPPPRLGNGAGHGGLNLPTLAKIIKTSLWVEPIYNPPFTKILFPDDSKLCHTYN